MYPRSFDYSAPTTVEGAVRDLAARPDAKVLAGGMSLIPMMKLRVLSPAAIIDLGRIPGLEAVTEHGGRVELGAMVRHHQVATSRTLLQRATALAEAAGWTGDVQVRNRGTLCGSLAHADSAADQPAAVIALEGSIEARSERGVRTIPATDFFLDAFTTALAEDEILTGASIPLASPGEGSAYRKVGRRGGSDGFAVAGAAAWVKLAEGAVLDARVALTGVSTRPLAAEGVREAFVGSDASQDAVQAAAERAAEGVQFIADLYGSIDYKAHLAKLLTARALSAAVDRAG